MADRFPLIVDSSSQQIKELPDGDNLTLGDSEKLLLGDSQDLELFHISDEIGDTFQYVTDFLNKNEMKGPNF